jgi:hypothetical protein
LLAIEGLFCCLMDCLVEGLFLVVSHFLMVPPLLSHYLMVPPLLF